MDWKSIGKALLFPPLAVTLVLVPVSATFLVYSMVCLGTKSVMAILSYLVAAYTLTVWLCKTPCLIAAAKRFQTHNRYAVMWKSNPHLRIRVSLYAGLCWNTAYALLHMGMGFWHRTFWFFSLAGYYLCLALMRIFLVRQMQRDRSGTELRREWIKYRACGLVLLVMNVALSLMIFFMVYWNRTFHHHEITTIALAAYTFTSLTMAVVNLIRYRKYNSPVYSASKAIGLAAALVSVLTLESTMLTTFGAATLTLTHRRLFLGISGGVISALIIAMAIYMMVQANKKMTAEKELSNGTTQPF